MARKLSPITPANLIISFQISNNGRKYTKDSNEYKKEGKRKNLTVRRARLYRKMPIFAHEEKLFCMKTIANILAFVSTYTVIAMVFLIIVQSFIKLSITLTL